MHGRNDMVGRVLSQSSSSVLPVWGHTTFGTAQRLTDQTDAPSMLRKPRSYPSQSNGLETFRGATGPLPAGPTPLAPTPPPGPDLDLTLTRFRPDFDLKSAFLGPNQVEIGSKSGPGGGVGARGVGLAGGVPVAPPESHKAMGDGELGHLKMSRLMY